MSRSYTTDGLSFAKVGRSAWRQMCSILTQNRRLPEVVRNSLSSLESFHKSAEALTGLTLHDRDVLEIGHGQTQFAAAYVASLGNRVVGIDTDAVPNGIFDLPGYIRTLRVNGAMRAAKTLARDVIGFNRGMRREFIRQRGLRSWPRYKTIVADASHTAFPDRSFDFLYSFYVLEHVSSPAAVLEEVSRLLRPGGAFLFRFPHYAHYNALHDLRWITRNGTAPKPWAHLLDAERHTVQQGAFVNTLRIDDWQRLFDHFFPGAIRESVPIAGKNFVVALNEIRRDGLLPDFGDDELLTNDLIYAWRKP